jgi:hypothetical protein
MKRFAAHYIFIPPHNLYKLHAIELNDDRQIVRISPLEKETASTFFCNGIIFAVNVGTFSSQEEVLRIWEEVLQEFPGTAIPELFKHLPFKEIAEGKPVNLYHLDGIDLLPPKFCTDNGGSYCHIQRLC